MVALSQPLLDSGRLGVIVLDPDFTVIACHGKLVDWLMPGVQAMEAIPALAGLEEILKEIATGALTSFSLPRISWRTGNPADDRVFSLEIVPGDEPGLLHLVLRDETDIATLEREIIQKRNELSLAYDAAEQARDRAENALREKAAFLANISHDLKTPLQVIMGNAEILKGDLPKEERDGFLQDISDNSDFLLALITDLLEASALEAEQLELHEEPIDVDEMLSRIVSMACRLPGGSSKHFALDIDEQPVMVRGDPMRLQRLLLNIVSNAVKFTDDGGHVSISRRKSDDGDLNVEVRDDGCGIEKEMIGRVFDPFVRSGKAEGTGLGLHIAKGIANLHQGQLLLASRPGDGTTATLSLPKCRLIDNPT